MSFANLYPQLASVGQVVIIDAKRNDHFAKLPREALVIDITKQVFITYWVNNIHGRKVPIDNTFIEEVLA